MLPWWAWAAVAYLAIKHGATSLTAGKDPKVVVFYGQLVVLALCALAVLQNVLPLPLPFSNLALFSSVGLSVMVIKLNHGESFPAMAFSKEVLGQIQMFINTVMMRPDGQMLMFSLVWLSQPNVIVVGLLLRWRLWAVCTYAAANAADSAVWGRVSGLWAKLRQNELSILRSCTALEIGLGFMAILNIVLIGLPAALTALMHWNFLKLRYQSQFVPGGRDRPTKPGVLHGEVWANIGARTEPLVRAVPVLSTVIEKGRGWFQPQFQYKQG
eukprot:TRINITY_DN33641_c0_g1_i1.p1 TRINITY_DN33641_c0_g1~~TRINITY_DN33641_c0_g1_i1.p1  ORF type:complete len:270 (+),score=94.58 TRINITY_DN33641_c0_g1_i1:93-902(+)